MDLINKQVKHKRFGKGNIVSCTDSVVEVLFPIGSKKFVFPDAFEAFLTLLDEDATKNINKLIEKNEIEQLREELEQEMERSLHYKEQQCLMEWEKQMRNNKIHPSSQAAFWCKSEEQDTIFKEWKVFTGVKKSGAKEGQPNKPMRMHQNSVCLLTEREAQSSEKERRIIGLFLVSETFVGKACEDGYVPAHTEYRIRLSEKEQLLFWNYYINERFPHKMTWNTGTYRYIENICVAQVLRDIVQMRKNSEDGEMANNFYKHFCHMNQILENELVDPRGALKNLEV